ncbi:MAG: mechanosensitive ion channel [Lachnospiraceae bacterium]|nr:mechanosensitive ion channel [Lachnospiraceae bacterium]
MMIFLTDIKIEDLGDVAEVEKSIFRQFTDNLKLNSLDFLMRVLIAVVVLLLGIRVIRFVRKWFSKLLEVRGLDESMIRLLDEIIRFVLYFLLIMFIAAHFGVDAASIIAILGSAGLTLGLAFQGALSNFAGGVLIMSTKPFKIGDFIEITGSHTGTVTGIGLVHTRLLTIDNRVIIVPNGELANTTIINYTDREKRRVELEVSIPYSQDIDAAKKVISDVIREEPLLLKEDDILIYVNAMSSSSVDLGIKVYTKTENYLKAKWSLTENLKKALDANGIEIPFTQVDVHMR